MLTLILGGARSGKSRFAESLIGARRAIYIATARRDDDSEMDERIARHRRDRDRSWTTIEEPEDVPAAVREATPLEAPVLVDCATVWLSNLFARESHNPAPQQDDVVLNAARDLAAASRTREVIAVSNEIGAGGVPMTRVGRRFRDLHGWANQILAAEAADVVLVVAGLPLVIKGAPRKSDSRFWPTRVRG